MRPATKDCGPPLSFSVADMSKTFKHVNPCKAVGPDCINMVTIVPGLSGCVLSPLLYSLFTHDCVAKDASNSVLKFADDTTVVGLITNDDKTVYREEVRALWCLENNLSLNVNITKEMILDFRKQQREHPPIHIDGTVVESAVSSSAYTSRTN